MNIKIRTRNFSKSKKQKINFYGVEIFLKVLGQYFQAIAQNFEQYFYEWSRIDFKLIFFLKTFLLKFHKII